MSDDTVQIVDLNKSSKHSPDDQKNGNNVLVSVNADTLNIHSSNLSALERLARHSPAIAEKLIESTEQAAEQDTRKYVTGAVAAAAVACVMLTCTTAVIIHAGFLAGLLFFAVCAAVSAIFSAVFTGKSQSLSWTVELLRGSNGEKKNKQD